MPRSFQRHILGLREIDVESTGSLTRSQMVPVILELAEVLPLPAGSQCRRFYGGTMALLPGHIIRVHASEGNLQLVQIANA